MKRLSGNRKCPSPGRSTGRRTHSVLDMELPASMTGMTHTLDSNAISRNKASAIMIKKERRADAEAALKTVDATGDESALRFVVGSLGTLLSMSGDVDCTRGRY